MFFKKARAKANAMVSENLKAHGFDPSKIDIEYTLAMAECTDDELIEVSCLMVRSFKRGESALSNFFGVLCSHSDILFRNIPKKKLKIFYRECPWWMRLLFIGQSIHHTLKKFSSKNSH